MGKKTPEDNPIVILGATGNQGSTVLQHLYTQQKGFLYAVTRDVNGVRAKQVETVFQGVNLIRADLEDEESLKAALQPINGKPVSVFAISTPSLASKGYACDPEAEVKAGLALVKAAKEAGVAHVVFSSAASCDKDNAPAYYKSKAKIEEALKASGIKYTILRPVTFIETWERVHPICRGKVVGMIKGDVKQQWVSLMDVGAVAALALRNPDQYVGKTIDLVGDVTSGNELAEAMTRMRGGTKFSYSIAWFTRLVMYFLAPMIYSDRVTYQMDGGFTGDLKPLKNLADKFPPEFKRTGVITYERALLSAGYQTKVLPKFSGVGFTILKYLAIVNAIIGGGAMILPEILPQKTWEDMQRRWAFYCLCGLLVVGLVMQLMARRGVRR